MNLLLSKKMHYFITLMEVRCINEAADRLCITRSPVGKILAELEEFIGSPLFTRKYNILEPTLTAINLYERVKPLYDCICSIESDFSSTSKNNYFELVFDSNIPFPTFQYLTYKLKLNNIQVNCRMIEPNENVSSFSLRSNIAFFTYDTILNINNLREIKIGKEMLVLMVQKGAHHGIIDPNEKTTLLVRKGDIPRGLISTVLDFMNINKENIVLKESDVGLPELLLQTCASNTMLLVPEYLSLFIGCPLLKKIKIPEAIINKTLYINKGAKNGKMLNRLVDELSIYSPQSWQCS